MSNGRSKYVPKTQPGAGGGPPKPPKKTAGGLEDGLPEPEFTRLDFAKARLQIAKRLIDGASKQLVSLDLVPAATRVAMQQNLKQLYQLQRKAQHQIKELQRQQGGGE